MKESFSLSFPPVFFEDDFQIAAEGFCAGIPGSYLFWSQPLNKREVHLVSKAKHPAPFLIHKLFFFTLHGHLFRKRK